MGLDKRQTLFILALATLDCLILVIGITVVVRPHTLRITPALVAAMDTPTARRATPTPIPAASQLPARSIIPTATLAFTQTEMLVLQQVAQRVCCGYSLPCNQQFYARETHYSFGCWAAAGHSASVEIQRLRDEAEAHAAFETARGNNPVERFHGNPAATWQYDQNPDNPGFPMRHRQHAWQVDRWLIIVSAFDDTHYVLAPEPAEVSEIVFQEAVARCLFSGPPCRTP